MLTVALSGRLPSGISKAVAVKLARAAYLRGGGKHMTEMSISIVTDAQIRKLNRQYRGKDKVTDVLSFGMGEALMKGAPRELGDIFISLPQVRRQAKRIDRPVATEFALMVVHGTLHLMGYDHETLTQERRMFGLQHDVLAAARYI